MCALQGEPNRTLNVYAKSKITQYSRSGFGEVVVLACVRAGCGLL